MSLEVMLSSVEEESAYSQKKRESCKTSLLWQADNVLAKFPKFFPFWRDGSLSTNGKHRVRHVLLLTSSMSQVEHAIATLYAQREVRQN
jgi:hypothetical protein